MLRRDFLKYLSSLPIVGTLFAQGETGASEGQRKVDKSDYNYVRQCLSCGYLHFTKMPEKAHCLRCQEKERSGTEYICETDGLPIGKNVAFSLDGQHEMEERLGWRFYINGKEVDISRAMDENGAMCWPFQGAKSGDVCRAEFPAIDYERG